MSYTYDNNGNLLNDGVNTYAYDSANQLISMSGPAETLSYKYSGLGDRLQETVNGTTTTFIMDLAAGLTQTLNDGTYDYIYGIGRIAQVNGSGVDYFLGDALSSVRQLTDSSGAVTLAQNYAPYGTVSFTSGSASSYGFTGEYESQGLVYLRARMYAPATGRFLTRDTWEGNTNNPMSFNKWPYTEGNPINYTDPSGYITPHEAYEAGQIADELESTYNVIIDKDWGLVWWDRFNFNPFDDVPFITKHCEWWNGNWRNIEELRTVAEGVRTTANGIGTASKFKSAMKNQPVHIYRVNINGEIFRHRAMPIFDIVYSNYAMDNKTYIIYTTVHEFGHIWDIRNWLRLSNNMSITLNTTQCVTAKGRQATSCYFDITKGEELPPGEKIKPYAGTNALEDWAEAFANYIYPKYYGDNPSYNQLGPIRRKYVHDQINAIP